MKKSERFNGISYLIGVTVAKNYYFYYDPDGSDRTEGLGRGYADKVVQVRLTDGEVVEAITYYAIRVDPTLKPLEWYKSHVLQGAREHGVPEVPKTAVPYPCC